MKHCSLKLFSAIICFTATFLINMTLSPIAQPLASTVSSSTYGGACQICMIKPNACSKPGVPNGQATCIQLNQNQYALGVYSGAQQASCRSHVAADGRGTGNTNCISDPASSTACFSGRICADPSCSTCSGQSTTLLTTFTTCAFLGMTCGN